jgi:hypothetical protein
MNDDIRDPVEFFVDQKARGRRKLMRVLNRHLRIDFEMKFNVVLQPGFSGAGFLHA